MFGSLGALLLTPVLIFPAFGASGDFDFSAMFKPQKAEAQEWRVDRDRDWGSWWDWRPDRDDRPEIESIDPSSGPAGSEVTISGENFDDDSTVRFGRETIDDVQVSDDGTELTFSVPEDADDRRYNVRVNDDDGNSNQMRFTVTESDEGDEDLSITGIDGPTSLDEGESGTWTVNVEGSYEGDLRYSVKWGDEGNALMRLFGADDEETQTSASFSHTYRSEGTYTPEFTVTDEDGNTVSKASASVTVGEDGELRIDSIDPASGEVGSEVTIEGDGFADNATVRIGGTAASDVTVVDDSTITFTVPELDARTYNVVVRQDGERSNSMRYTVTEDSQVDGWISISGIDAPSRLSVGESGEWTVHADTNLEGNLSYSVSWGDEGRMARMMAADSATQSSASFSHTYRDEGTYKPVFTVTNDEGQSETVSATVVVTDAD